MRVLLPEPAATVDLHAFYGTDWLETGGVRANFVSSVDGAVSVDGLSRGLQTPGDNAVFAALRDLADVVLVAAGTARAEGYSAQAPGGRRGEMRARLGLAAALPIAVVSGSLDLDLGSRLFTGVDGAPTTVVITHAAADASRLAAVREVADVIVAGAAAVDLPEAVAHLRARGLRRVLHEGGPTLFASMVGARAVTELCLSVSGALAGPGSGRITSGAPWSPGVAPVGLRLAGLLEDGGALFARYRFAG